MNVRKTVKMRPTAGEDNEIYSTQENPRILGGPERKMILPPSIEDTEVQSQEMGVKVNSLLNKITGFSDSDRGNQLANFNPPPKPEMTARLQDEPIGLPRNPLMPSLSSGPSPAQKPAYYKPMEPNTYSNYSQVYPDTITNIKPETGGPYYAKMGIAGSNSNDKLNYMVHLLEEMQMEKTNHVTEEFVLYTLLGVFMIYLVDGFSRTGKYVR